MHKRKSCLKQSFYYFSKKNAVNLQLHPKSIVITGPTASGKTALAINLAQNLAGEIISVDSRQFYKEMNIGTGKDLEEFGAVKHHLIDIASAGDQLNISQFKKYFFEAHKEIINKGKQPILCGGTANYLLSILKKSKYTEVPVNDFLRSQLELLEHQELIHVVATCTIPKEYIIDTSTKKRCIRIIEVLTYLASNALLEDDTCTINPIIFGLNPPNELRRQRITDRLNYRLQNGLIEEVQMLREKISDEQLVYYGLEYKYMCFYLNNTLSKQEAFSKLETEIHRYAKRQMTFLRKIEKEGFLIQWIPFGLSTESKIEFIFENLRKNKIDCFPKI